jgi:hypothetical protein
MTGSLNVQAVLLFEIWINVGLGITFAHSRLVLLWGFNSKFFITGGYWYWAMYGL